MVPIEHSIDAKGFSKLELAKFSTYFLLNEKNCFQFQCPSNQSYDRRAHKHPKPMSTYLQIAY